MQQLSFLTRFSSALRHTARPLLTYAVHATFPYRFPFPVLFNCNTQKACDKTIIAMFDSFSNSHSSSQTFKNLLNSQTYLASGNCDVHVGDMKDQ